jgi:translation elongation factor EF-G
VFEDDFKGVVNLIDMKAIIWDEESRGMKFEEVDIPDDLKAKVDELREQVVETAAEANEELMDAYIESGELTREEIVQGASINSSFASAAASTISSLNELHLSINSSGISFESKVNPWSSSFQFNTI